MCVNAAKAAPRQEGPELGETQVYEPSVPPGAPGMAGQGAAMSVEEEIPETQFVDETIVPDTQGAE